MGQQNAPSGTPSAVVQGGVGTQPNQCDAEGNLLVVVANSGLLPDGAVQLSLASGSKANAAATATLAAALAATTYLTGFDATATGSTAGSVQNVTVSLGAVTLTYVFKFPDAASLVAQPLSLRFNPPLPASAPDTPITVTLPAGGSGNAHAALNAYGYRK